MWPEYPGDEDLAVAYLHKRLDAREMRRALDAPLSPDFEAGCIVTIQNDWTSHYRFTYGLLAAFVFAPDDPAQWFIGPCCSDTRPRWSFWLWRESRR